MIIEFKKMISVSIVCSGHCPHSWYYEVGMTKVANNMVHNFYGT